MSFRVISAECAKDGVLAQRSVDTGVPHMIVHECGFAPIVDDWLIRAEVTSPFWCMWHSLEKGQWIESAGVRWDLGPDHLVFVPALVDYTPCSTNPVSQLWLHFSPVPGYAFEADSPLVIPLNALLREQIAALIKVFDSPGQHDVRIFHHYASGLLHNSLACHPLALRALPESLLALLQLIEQAPTDDLSNARLANLMNVSVSSFIRWFEAHMKQSPAAYVRHVRHQQASRLLMYSNDSIEQISADLGYPNRHYFSRAFARHAGCGPATFRKRRRR